MAERHSFLHLPARQSNNGGMNRKVRCSRRQCGETPVMRVNITVAQNKKFHISFEKGCSLKENSLMFYGGAGIRTRVRILYARATTGLALILSRTALSSRQHEQSKAS